MELEWVGTVRSVGREILQYGFAFTVLGVLGFLGFRFNQARDRWMYVTRSAQYKSERMQEVQRGMARVNRWGLMRRISNVFLLLAMLSAISAAVGAVIYGLS